MPSRARILLLIPHLGGGGAEAVMALLASNLSREKYELHLCLVTQSAVIDSQVPADVQVHCFGCQRVRSASLKLVRLVRALQPALILSGMFHVNFLVLALRPLLPRSVRIIVRQNGTVSSALAFGNVPTNTRLLYRMFYKRADRIICQSEAMADDLARELHIDHNKIAVLANPVDVEVIRRLSKPRTVMDTNCERDPKLIAVGRLAREKGFDLLLQAVAELRTEFPQLHLTIAGAGPEVATLKGLCRLHAIEAAVWFVGEVEAPAALFVDTTAFVLSSRQEGMPNALLEAAAAGLPIVATPASQGIVDLLSGQPGVWLASEASVPSLAQALRESLRELAFGQRFEHAFIEPFRMERAIAGYEAQIDEMIALGTEVQSSLRQSRWPHETSPHA